MFAVRLIAPVILVCLSTTGNAVDDGIAASSPYNDAEEDKLGATSRTDCCRRVNGKACIRTIVMDTLNRTILMDTLSASKKSDDAAMCSADVA